jgi:PAS domain S-box-containing protein
MSNDTSGKIRLGIGDDYVQLHTHITCFLENGEEFVRSISFLEEGLRGSDFCVLIGSEQDNERACRVLTDSGLQPDGAVAKGRIALVEAAETGEAILASVRSTLKRMLDAGAGVVRVFGNIGWLEPGWPPVGDLVVLEAKLTALAQEFPCVILCVVDTRTLPGIIMRHGGLESHPMMLHRLSLQRNPLYVPADAVLKGSAAMAETFVDLERKRGALQLYQKMFANMRDGLVIAQLDPAHPDSPPKVTEMNPVALRISGHQPDDLPEGSLLDYFPGLFPPDLGRTCDRLAGCGGADLGEAAFGEAFYRVQVFCLLENYVGVLFSETTEMKRTEKALLSLRKLSNMLQSTLEIENILDELVLETAAIVGAESGIAAFCSSGETSCYRYLKNGNAVAIAEGEGGVPPGRVIWDAEPYLANDAFHDPRIDPARAERFGVQSAISTPLLDLNGKMVGFLEMHNKRGGAGFTRFDQDQLASAAQTAALAIRNASAFRKISEMGSRLRESTERYRHLVEGIDAIVWEADAATIRFTYVSQRAEAILGYPVAQWQEPEFWVKHIHPEDRDRALAICRLASREGRDHRFVYRFLAADGRTVWLRDHARVVLNEQGKTVKLRGLMVDISETMAIEDLLRQSEGRFRSTFEGAGVGMALVDSDGRTLEVNPALLRMLGYSGVELAARNFGELVKKEDAPKVMAQFQALVAGKIARFQAEERFTGKDGRELWGLVTFSAVPGDEGRKYAVAMVQDITPRKEAEAEVAKLLAQVQKDAAELEKRVEERTAQLQEINAELDSFAHSVSHDLRAPLRALQGFAEILLEDGSTPESERLDYLKRILSAAQGMDRLIQDLLAYSRLGRQDLPLQPVSLEKVVHDAAQQLELASGGKSYDLQVATPLPEVLGHQAVLVQVLLNLMTNGIKFVPKGALPRLRIWAEDGERVCRLMVEDNGIGIAPQHQEQIFNIFERLHGIEEYPGTGVGLAIVRKAVTRLGGRIGVESREGEGSRFWIELPKPHHS